MFHSRQHCPSIAIVVLESKREFDKGLTDSLILAEISTSRSAPRNDKSPGASLRAKRSNLVMTFKNDYKP